MSVNCTVVSQDREFEPYSIDAEKPINSGEFIDTPAGRRSVVNSQLETTRGRPPRFVITVIAGVIEPQDG